MSHKVKVTFYCDEVDCMANQTFVTSIEAPLEALTGRGDRQSVLRVLTKTMGWEVTIPGQLSASRRVVTLCPRHRDRPGDSGLTSIQTESRVEE